MIAFVDDQGESLTGPAVSVTGAYPGMPPEVSTFTIANRSNVAATYAVAVDVTHPTEGLSLADVLVATVTVGSDATPVFRGPLAQLRLGGIPLAGGEHARHHLTIAWPDGGSSDNRYQGQTLDFDLQATGAPQPAAPA